MDVMAGEPSHRGNRGRISGKEGWAVRANEEGLTAKREG